LPQADLLVAAVRNDLRAWRLSTEEQLRFWADDPASAASHGTAIRDRLVARMSSLEAQIGETIRGVKEGQISEGEIEFWGHSKVSRKAESSIRGLRKGLIGCI